MKKRLVFVLFFVFSMQLYSQEEIVMESLVNKICKDCIKVYDSCTGTFMEINLSEDEYLNCREPEKVKLDTLANTPTIHMP